MSRARSWCCAALMRVGPDSATRPAVSEGSGSWLDMRMSGTGGFGTRRSKVRHSGLARCWRRSMRRVSMSGVTESLTRTFDVYSIALPGSEHPMANPITGSSSQIAEHLLAYEEMGFDEVRCDVYRPRGSRRWPPSSRWSERADYRSSARVRKAAICPRVT
jgi:hypothetical protein